MQTHIPATIALQPHRSHVVKAIFRNLLLQMARLRTAAGESSLAMQIAHLWISCRWLGGSEGAPPPIRRSTRRGTAETAVAHLPSHAVLRTPVLMSGRCACPMLPLP